MWIAKCNSRFLLAATAGLIVCFSSCNKGETEDKSKKLPEYSQRGANTFGCLINDEVFRPGAPAGSMYLPLQCDYQIINDTPFFLLGAGDLDNDQHLIIGLNRVFINRDTVILFRRAGVKRLTASYKTDATYITTDTVSGILDVKYFDLTRQIIAGTFWLDAINESSGEVIKIRDGRFDLRFGR
jgi:hypothetical protein